MQSRGKESEPTVEDFDKRISLVQRIRAPEALRAVYKDAADKFPDEQKYATFLKRYTTKPSNVYEDIELQLKKLRELQGKEDVTDKVSHVKAQDAILLRLSSLWGSVKHRINAMKYWTLVDDRQRRAFEEAQDSKKTADSTAGKPRPAEVKGAVAKPVGSSTKAQEAVVPNGGKSKSATVKKSSGKGASGVDKTSRKSGQTSPGGKTATLKNTKPRKNKATTGPKQVPEKKYAKGVQGVKDALDAGDEDGVLRSIRSVWRILPPAVSSPYGSRVRGKSLGYSWPATKSSSKLTKAEQEKTDEAMLAKESEARRLKRGGLSTFVPAVRPASIRRPGVWEVLAQHPYTLPEMRRIVRSSFMAPANARTVSLGLLKSRRIAKGDDLVLAGLIKDIKEGRGSKRVLDDFFVMVNEKPELIDGTNKWVLDVLMDQIGVKNASEARSLAPLYAQVGELEKAAMLYRVSVFFPLKTLNHFSSMVSDASEFFEGQELLNLAESMFETAHDRHAALPTVLELRHAWLTPDAAAAAMRRDFPSERVIHDTYDVKTLIAGTNIFASVGDYESAIVCLDVVLRQNGNPLVQGSGNPAQYYVNRGTTRPWLLTRQNFLDLFPAPKDASASAQKEWLKVASAAVRGLRDDDSVKRDGIVAGLLTIAYRQLEADWISDARETLDLVDDDLLKGAEKLEALAVDLMRDAGLVSRAVEVQTNMQREGRLSFVRFGEFVRDTAVLNGTEMGMKRFNTLVQLSMEKDLLAAGIEIAGDDPESMQTVRELQSQEVAAEEKYQKRLKAAAERRKRGKSPATVDEPAGAAEVIKAVPLSAPMKLRVLPLKRPVKTP